MLVFLKPGSENAIVFGRNHDPIIMNQKGFEIEGQVGPNQIPQEIVNGDLPTRLAILA